MSLTARCVLAGYFLLAPACGSPSPPELVPPERAIYLNPDAGAPAPDAAPVVPSTTCCRLDNERGERLSYMCGEAIDSIWAEARGYRCWTVPASE